MTGFYDLVLASQAADLNREAARLEEEKVRKAAWLAQTKLPGQYNVSQLLEKMGSTVAEGAATGADAPAPTEVKNVERPKDSQFPPPPIRTG